LIRQRIRKVKTEFSAALLAVEPRGQHIRLVPGEFVGIQESPGGHIQFMRLRQGEPDGPYVVEENKFLECTEEP
jgi:hypothetical protein